MSPSDHFNGKIFLNPVPTEMMATSTAFRLLPKMMAGGAHREPRKRLPDFKVDDHLLAQPPSKALRITWLGHSSLLVELEGRRFLTDPLWYNRVSPFKYLGPKRFFPNPLPLHRLPHIDFILLSHDHYDHMDKRSLLHLLKERIPVVTMLGVGKRLLEWGASPSLITEMDWWDEHSPVEGFTVTATPSRHFSGRWLNDRFSTLWGAFAIKAGTQNIFFGADSGYYDGFTEIGQRLGPFDVAMLETGAYNEAWFNIHMGPESAVQASIDVQANVMMPIHWGTFALAFHPWKEPIERVLQEAALKGVKVFSPGPGESRLVNGEAYCNEWWKRYE